MSSFRYGESQIYQIAPVIDHLFSEEETFTKFIVPSVKAFMHSFNRLRPRGSSAFNSRSFSCRRSCNILTQLHNDGVIVPCF